MSAAPVLVAPAPLRAARGSAVAAVGLLLAVVGHVAAGGSASFGALGLPVVALVVAACVVLSARRWTVGRLVAVLAVIQAVTHLSLLLAAPSGQVDPRLASLAAAARTTGHLHEHAVGLPPSMLLAHLVAVVVAAVLLARVDTAVTVLWHLARRLLLPVGVDLLPVPGRRPVPFDALLRAVRPSLVGSAASRRGPPLRPARA